MEILLHRYFINTGLDIPRAFYSDEHIVVMEGLLRERFLKVSDVHLTESAWFTYIPVGRRNGQCCELADETGSQDLFGF